jgi:two-component system response regulator (stage 0 sporulation protein F)
MILVVDDDAQVRATIVRSVAALGYGVREAASGRAAIAMIEAERPSMVILDFMMPGLDGAETAREIARIDAEIPVVFSTGHAALRALRNAAGDEASILEKPFTLEELDQLIRETVPARRVRA